MYSTPGCVCMSEVRALESFDYHYYWGLFFCLCKCHIFNIYMLFSCVKIQRGKKREKQRESKNDRVFFVFVFVFLLKKKGGGRK